MHTETVFARVITFPKPTVAAINGHAFGGGALLFLCCDYRVMSPNKGFFCLNEMEIHAGFTPGLNEILMQKVGVLGDKCRWTRTCILNSFSKRRGTQALRRRSSTCCTN
eukprot:Platyproteum_vivax@DN5294_c0_g1_i3.p1